METNEDAWLERVADRLIGGGSGVDAETKRMLLKVTKTTADVTGIRYLAPLTAYLIGRASGHAEAAGVAFDLKAAAAAISELAAGWDRPPEG